MSFIRFFMSRSWDFFDQIQFPGLNMTFAQYLIGFALVAFLIRLLGFFLSFPISRDSLGRPDRGRNVKISSKRSGDQW